MQLLNLAALDVNLQENFEVEIQRELQFQSKYQEKQQKLLFEIDKIIFHHKYAVVSKMAVIVIKQLQYIFE